MIELRIVQIINAKDTKKKSNDSGKRKPLLHTFPRLDKSSK